tara:strand:- start:277 stop:1137 length:861 start_codon:yes stop_codon:yes gene_type:complete
MPELPEVEVVKQSLIRKIKLKKIKKIIIRNRNLRFKIPRNFENLLKNEKILKISRFSKFIIFEFKDDKYCILHLGMSGTVHIVGNKKNFFTNTSFYHSPFLPNKHNHVEFIFKNFKVIYNDPRRFGYFKIIYEKKNLKKFKANYAIEPFDRNFNYSYVKKKLISKKKNIKNCLLDQKFVSGIGNIYASEILYLSNINPLKISKNISQIEIKKLVYFSKIVLRNAINKGGSSIRNFVNISGTTGNFQKYFKVYQREGKKCLKSNCNGKIMRIIVSNRSTFYCNICQK